MDGFALRITIPAIMSIRKIAVVDKANCRVNSSNRRVRAVRRSIGFHNTAKGVLAREVVVK